MAAKISHLVPAQRVTEEEVLSYLVARVDVPSSFGAQIANVQRLASPKPWETLTLEERQSVRKENESAYYALFEDWQWRGSPGKPAPREPFAPIPIEEKLRRRAEEEHRLWHTIPCKTEESHVEEVDEAVIESRLLSGARVMNCLAGLITRNPIEFAPCPDVARFAHAVRATQGAIVVGVLRAYEPWYGPRTGSEVPLAKVYEWMRAWNPATPLPVLGKEKSVVQAFRLRKAPAARKRALAMVADARVVMTEWVKVWNRRAATREVS